MSVFPPPLPPPRFLSDPSWAVLLCLQHFTLGLPGQGMQLSTELMAAALHLAGLGLWSREDTVIRKKCSCFFLGIPRLGTWACWSESWEAFVVQIRGFFLFLFFSFLPISLQRLFPFVSGHMCRWPLRKRWFAMLDYLGINVKRQDGYFLCLFLSVACLIRVNYIWLCDS